MSTTAFALLFLPACLAVPAGLALGAVAESLIERVGAAATTSAAIAARPRAARAVTADRSPRRAEGRNGLRGFPAPAATVAEERREPGLLGLCGVPDSPARRDEAAFLNARRPVGPAPWM